LRVVNFIDVPDVAEGDRIILDRNNAPFCALSPCIADQPMTEGLPMEPMMAAIASGMPRYRDGAPEERQVVLTERADGSLLARNPAPLADYPVHLAQRLTHWAKRSPDRVFVARRDGSGIWQAVTYAQMLERARGVGQALVDRGLSAERPLAILSENDLQHATLAAAALYAGIPYAPISTAYSLVSKDFGKLRHIVGLLTPGLVYVADGARYAPALAAAVPQYVEVVVGRNPPPGRASCLFQTLLQTRPSQAVDEVHARITAEAIAKFLFTSGSTRLPKGVINTQRMLCSNQQVLVHAFPFLAEEPPVLVDWLPWNHTFGGNHNFGMALYNGGTLYIDDGKPVQPLMQDTLRNLREISPTLYFNVPKGFEELVEALQADRELRERFFHRLRLMFYAGAGLPKPVADRLYAIAEEHCGERVGIYTGLGMTETAPFAIGTVRLESMAGVIGNPAPGVELKLVPQSGKLELRYRGPNVTPGYWRQPELTAASFDEEGYFRSGDAVRFVDRSDPARGFVFDGRIAEDFKLSTGTWVSVGPLRTAALIEGAPHVLDVVVTGHDRDEVGLLIFPRLDSCRALAGMPAHACASEVLNSAPVRAFFVGMLDRLQAQATGSANHIARAVLLADAPSIDSGEMTDKGSINQRVVLRERQAAIETMYAGGPDVLLSKTLR
jgi:feruloyl-CoA synthase